VKCRMATFKDLSRYSYDDTVKSKSRLVNIGWLGADAPFPEGDTDPKVVAVLARLAVDSQNVMRGYHYCEFCDAESPLLVDVPGVGEAVLGTGEIHVPAGDDGPVYVAPTLVVHYIEAHHYRPPDEFVRAVEALA
jgi:hypothetical protein